MLADLTLVLQSKDRGCSPDPASISRVIRSFTLCPPPPDLGFLDASTYLSPTLELTFTSKRLRGAHLGCPQRGNVRIGDEQLRRCAKLAWRYTLGDDAVLVRLHCFVPGKTDRQPVALWRALGNVQTQEPSDSISDVVGRWRMRAGRSASSARPAI